MKTLGEYLLENGNKEITVFNEKNEQLFYGNGYKLYECIGLVICNKEAKFLNASDCDIDLKIIERKHCNCG